MRDGRVEVRCYGDLADLAGARVVEVPVGEPRSVKDLVESVGVPHPEVGLWVVDGTPVGDDHRLAGGERVAVYPPFTVLDVRDLPGARPVPADPRFLLDVHLGALARRLRLLGFDARWQREATDAWLAGAAVADARVLLTRDRELLMRREVRWGYCPRADDPDAQAEEVVMRFDLADRLAPFTRCPRCNGRLHRVDKAEVAARLPPRTRAAFEEFARCDACGQVYWKGAHHARLEGFLARVGAREGRQRRGRAPGGRWPAGADPDAGAG